MKIYTTIDPRLQQYAEEAVEEKMKMLQKRFYTLWGNKNPWQDLDGNEIKDFVLKNEQKLPIYAKLQKKYGNNTALINQYFERPKHMKVFTWHGESDTTFSTIDSI